jgi:peroxiredoxin
MNRLIYFVLSISFFACTQKTPETGFKIIGTLDSLNNGLVTLKRYFDGTWNNIDTATVESGKFLFEGRVDLPEMFRVEIADTLPYIPIFVENSEIKIIGSIDSLQQAKIIGSRIQEEYENFWNQLKPFTSKLDSIENLYYIAKSAGNNPRMNELDTLYESVAKEQAYVMMPLVLESNKSVVSAYVTWIKLVHHLNTNELDSITAGFDSTLNKSVYVKMLKDYIAVLRRTEIGQPAIDFTMNDTEGKPVSLSLLYGKYLLIDFWASWCSPCRRENPNVVQAYKQYHKKGFDILGVSFDRKKEAWLKAIKEDKLVWTHVSDLKYWGNEAGKAYGIRSIPSNVLLDPKGIIIAKNLHGKDLQNKLKEIFNK